MGSTRLPGKVLKEVNGKPLLQFMLSRASEAKLIDKIVIATTNDKLDDPIADFCVRNNFSFYRGSENDVLDRYFQIAKTYGAQIIIRCTADCPLIDGEVIDATVSLFLNSNVDYASNTCPPKVKTYPDGSDVEVFSFDALERAWKETKNPKDREHVTFYFWDRGQNFKTALLNNKQDWGKYRITLDYPEDLIAIEKIIKRISEKKIKGSLGQIVNIIDNDPEILGINSKYSWGMNW